MNDVADECRLCDPHDVDCVETDEVKTCQFGECRPISLSDGNGDSASSFGSDQNAQYDNDAMARPPKAEPTNNNDGGIGSVDKCLVCSSKCMVNSSNTVNSNSHSMANNNSTASSMASSSVVSSLACF